MILKTKRNEFHGMQTMTIDTKNNSVGGLIKKLEHFIHVCKYANVCKLDWSILKTKSNDFHGVENMDIDTKNISPCDLVANLCNIG